MQDALFRAPDIQEAEHVRIRIILVLQANHEPLLAIALFRLPVDFLHPPGAFRQNGLQGLLFLSSGYKHYGEKGFPGVNGAEGFSEFFEFDIPPRLPAAGAEFYFLFTVIFCFDFRTEFLKQRISDGCSDFLQCGAVGFVL